LITSAVVPVAGMGTRMLPATKSQPKEMLPVGKKPIVQYVVEELVSAGIEQILFVTGRGKHSIENHFDFDHQLMRLLRETGKEDLLEELEFERFATHFFYTRQRTQRGLGDAILCAERFAGESSIAVALGDSIIGMHTSACVRRMIEAAGEDRDACIIAVEEVDPALVGHYGVIKPASASSGELFEIADLVEKPSPAEAPSNLVIAGRYVLPPSIFEAIRRTEPGANGEIQLTDAIRLLRENGCRLLAQRLPAGERRYDIGNFESYFETFIEFALADPEYGSRLRERVKTLLS
jgi:UTP--glucose-1-phosphate uridylyltransferase